MFDEAVSPMDTGLRDRLEGFFRQRHDGRVIAAYLHGSHARGADIPQSDVDVGIVLDPEVGLDAAQRLDLRAGLIGEIVGALGINEVDVVILNEVPAPFAAAVVRDGVRVFDSGSARLREFERDVQLRAGDLLPFLKRHRRRQLERLGR